MNEKQTFFIKGQRIDVSERMIQILLYMHQNKCELCMSYSHTVPTMIALNKRNLVDHVYNENKRIGQKWGYEITELGDKLIKQIMEGL